MAVGWRNRLIGWIGHAVPFDPDKSHLLTSAERAVAVLKADRVLAIAGEGRLTEDEDVVSAAQRGAAVLRHPGPGRRSCRRGHQLALAGWPFRQGRPGSGRGRRS